MQGDCEFEPAIRTVQQWVKQATMDEGLRRDGMILSLHLRRLIPPLSSQ
jgi:hypothetical protein